MRVLITRPEHEAAVLARALAERGHVSVIAPLFQLAILRPPDDFGAALAACQAVLLTSANGARALAEASEQRSKPVFAVGDTTAATAEGLGFTAVSSAAGDAAALAELVRQRLDPGRPLVHVSGVDVAGELALPGFEVRRFALYEARAAATLPGSARAALQARALDAATFFSQRASTLFARLVAEADLGAPCRALTAVAISAAAAQPLGSLPFKAVTIARRPTRQAVLDEIDRLAEQGVQLEQQESQEPKTTMSDTPPAQVDSPPPTPPPVVTPVRRGPGAIAAFLIGLLAALVVLAAALLSLPYWPQDAREMWRGASQPNRDQANSNQESLLRQAQADAAAARTQAAAAQADAAAAKQQAAAAEKQASLSQASAPALEAFKRDLGARLDDLDKRVRAAATTAAQADRPAVNDAALAELRSRVEAVEARPPGNPDADKELAALKKQVDTLGDASQRAGAEGQKALSAARASSVIGIAARLSAAVEQGLPFAAELQLLKPLSEGDGKLAEAIAALQPHAVSGVAARTTLANEFPAMAKAALADDLADDSFGERVLAKVRAIVSLRRVGPDVPGDGAEARLARAEAALTAGDLAKAVELVKALPPQTSRATSAWLAQAEAHLAAQRAVDQLAAEAVALLGAARP
jgi:uroporphyrinogen-III synthase